MEHQSIPRAFFDRNPIEVAKELLGKLIVRNLDGHTLVGKITETEAYLPSGDSAAHNFKGKTKRNESLYKEAGHAYVHSMRQYFLIDVVTEGTDKPGSVLVRAFKPIQGVEEMKRLRQEEDVEKLANGPGKVCMALGITRTLDGVDMTNPKNGLFLAENPDISSTKVISSSRIGISTAKEMQLRFNLERQSPQKGLQ